MELLDIRDTEGIPEGLSSEEVEALKKEGKVNISDEKVGKSYWRIIRENVFTYFNLVWAVVTILLVLCQSYANMTYLAIILPNMLISIFQEMKAKRTVEKLSVTTEPKATVIRDGELVTVNADEIVLGDVMLVEMGRQVLSDAVVVSGLGEANESMLTGESDAIKKQVGDKILAGSFFVGGSVYAKVINVGRDNYVHKIEKAAKSFKPPSSNLFNDLNRLIKSIGIFLIPMAVTLFASNFFSYRNEAEPLITAVVKTCGSVAGMIPAGIYLLVTLTLTLSVINLSKKETLVQDMYSIEMLASADVLCLDKTGTITD
jgi:cation-transporting ATPase E